MKNMSQSGISLLIGLAVVLVSIILQSAPLVLVSGLFVLISLSNFVKYFIKRIFARSGRTYYPSFVAIAIIGYVFLATSSVLITGFIAEWDLRFSSVIAIIIFNLFASVLYTYLYFLPYLIANKREHSQTHAIYILNIFAGWTVLAWIIGLIWAYTVPKESTVIHQELSQSGADELKKYKELLDQKIISEEEFEAKKKQILGL